MQVLTYMPQTIACMSKLFSTKPCSKFNHAVAATCRTTALSLFAQQEDAAKQVSGDQAEQVRSKHWWQLLQLQHLPVGVGVELTDSLSRVS